MNSHRLVCLLFVILRVTSSYNLDVSMQPKVEMIESPYTEVGEGPHWDAKRCSLYYVDILGGKILRFDYREQKIYEATVEGYSTTISFIVPVEDKDDKFVIGAGLKVVLIKWDGRSSEATAEMVLGEVDLSKPDNRFNDAKADSKGRLWCGTMGSEDKTDVFVNKTGSLYRFDNVKNFIGMKNDIGISNGLTWNEKLKKFYYIDSTSYDIKEFDYDEETGNITNERMLVNLKAEYDPLDFVGDGMTIDTEGNLYVATFFGSRILKINPSGKIEKEISIPTSQVTSLAFGGPNLDILFVTTAGKPKPQPEPAGKLFKVTNLGTKGINMYNYKLE